MHPDAVPREEWFTLEAPSGHKEDRVKVLVRARKCVVSSLGDIYPVNVGIPL